MAPNIGDTIIIEPEEINTNGLKIEEKPPVSNVRNDNYNLMIFQSSINLLAHMLIGATVGICLCFAVRRLPMDATQVHIILCVIGYQLLMAQATLSLTSQNGWSTRLKLVDKRRAHWILQLVGSIMAIVGSIIKSLDKPVNFNTLHGKFALVAMVFTFVSLINGVTSLYAYELRGKINGTFSKLTHILFGTVGFVTASVSLCYGFDTRGFITWATIPIVNTLIVFTALFTLIVCVNPMITFANKTLNAVGK